MVLCQRILLSAITDGFLPDGAFVCPDGVLGLLTCPCEVISCIELVCIFDVKMVLGIERNKSPGGVNALARMYARVATVSATEAVARTELGLA